MSVESVVARVAQLESTLDAQAFGMTLPADPISAGTASTTAASASSDTAAGTPSPSFASTLVSALAPQDSGDAALLEGDGLDAASPSTPTTPSSPTTPLPTQSLLGADPALASELPATADSLPSTALSAAPDVSLSSLAAVDPSLAGDAVSAPAAGGGNQLMVAIARSQVGVTEQPPGSNDAPAIAQYRTATTGALAGAPWCAYFASWVARQAGVPLGDAGQGFGAVADIWSWAQQNGRAVPNGPGVVPEPGDLIVFGDQHVGIVDRVLPNGDIETIEGNYNNSVSLVVRSPDEATGYVRMS